MKGRLIALDNVRGRRAAAMVVDGELDDLLIDCPPDIPRPGTIFRGIAGRPMKGQGGLIVDLGDGLKGFLRQWRGIAPGQHILVEVTGFAWDGKAIPVTTRLSIKGRYVILTPGAPGRNLSKAIDDDAIRLPLLALVGDLDLPEEIGLIVRSRAAGAAMSDVEAEAVSLADAARSVWSDRHTAGAELLLDGPDPYDVAFAEWPEPDAIDSGKDVFETTGVLDAIDALESPESVLPGGARMIIQPTSALVAVDVDTAAAGGHAPALSANIEAARALPRQLRCRGLGGQIVVDFAPSPKRDRHRIEQTLQAAFRKDPEETVLAGWTPLGNFEIQRRRSRLPLKDTLR